MDNNDLKKSGIIAVIITFIALAFWFGFSKLSLGAYNEKNLTKQFLAEDSKVFSTIVIEVGTPTVARIVAGTTSMTLTGTSSYPGQPRIEYDGATGKWSFKNSGGTQTTAFGSVTADYVASQIAASVGNYVLQNSGSSTGQLATNATLAGQGTITASFNTNGLVITPAEFAMVDGATIPLNIATGSITNHVHSGSDGTVQISHTNLTSKGTWTHSQLDAIADSKGSATGLASLDANSLVVQNPASGTSTPGIGKIPLSLGTGFLNDLWLSSVISKLGADIQLGTETTGNTDNITEGNTNKYYTDARVNSVIGSSNVGSRLNEQIVSVADGHHFVYDSASAKWKNATSTASVGFGGITGSPTDSSQIIVTSLGTASSGKVPAGNSAGELDNSWIPNVLRLSATTTVQAAHADGQFYIRHTPAVALSPLAVLILHGNGSDTSTTITNSSGSGIVVHPGGNAQIDTAQSVFGGGSILYDGTTDFVAGSDTASVLMNQDFQLDMRVRFNALSVQDFYYQQTDGANLSALQLNNGTSLLRFFVDVAGIAVVNLAYSWSPVTSTWYALRVALDASENTYYMWINGSLVQTLVDTDKPTDYTGDFYFGRGSTPSESNINGWQDETTIRIGTGSVETTGTYTVANSEYSAVSWDRLAYKAPQGATVLEIKTPGTSMAEKSVMAVNATSTIFGSLTSAYDGSLSVYAVDASIGNCIALSYIVPSTSDTKIVGEKGIRTKYLDDMRNLEIELSYRLTGKKISREDAENNAKTTYIARGYDVWKSQNIGSYTTTGGQVGSLTTTINYDKMVNDYRIIKELEWAASLDQQELINNEITKVTADMEKENLGLVVDRATTPDYLKSKDKRGRDIASEIGFNQLVIQELIEKLDNTQVEIGSLTAALENQKIAYNEEVDNLYNLINAIIATVVVLGGVGGFTTMRRKRKGT